MEMLTLLQAKSSRRYYEKLYKTCSDINLAEIIKQLSMRYGPLSHPLVLDLIKSLKQTDIMPCF